MQHQAIQIQMRINATQSHIMNMTMGGAPAAKSQMDPVASPIYLVRNSLKYTRFWLNYVFMNRILAQLCPLGAEEHRVLMMPIVLEP